MIKKLHIVFLTCLISGALWAFDETIVVGDVFNKITGEPIPNCNIYFKRSNIGTSSNEEGFFMVRTSEKHSGVLIVSALGYKTEEFKIAVGEYKGLQVELVEKNTMLPDLMVLPGANPAWELIKKVRLHRADNDLAAKTNHNWQALQEQQLFVSNLSTRTLQRPLFKSLKEGVFTAADSTHLMPIYVKTEQVRSDGKNITSTPVVEQENLLPSATYQQLLLPLFETPNFYQNTIAIADKQFISPLSSTGNSFYLYYLHDSITTPTGKQYQIRFKSKNSFNLAFSGDLYIDSATCALTSIVAKAPASANINYVRSVHIRQDFAFNGTTFEKADERLTYLMDVSLSLDSLQSTPSLFATQHRAYVTHQSDSVSPTCLLPADSTTQSQEYNIPTVEQMMNAMEIAGNTKLMRFAKWFGTTITTCYAPAGYIDVGDVIQLVSFNRIEAARFGIPLRTSEKLMKNLCIQGYVDYGIRDHAWKHMEQIQYQFPNTRYRHLIGFKYVDDYTRTDMNWFNTFILENCMARGFMDFTTGLLCVKPIYNFNRQREFSLFTYNDINRNWETKFFVRLGKYSYGDATAYHAWWRLPSFQYGMLNAQVRLSFDDTKVKAHLQRLYIYGKKPVLNLGIELGGYKMPERPEVLPAYSNKYHYYAKLHFNIQQRIRLGIMGEMHYLIEGGHIFGNVPYPFLQSFHGNETWAWDRYRFTLMNQSEFIADTYIDGHFRWNMGGILFNQIPGIRRLKLRELFECKIAYGSLRSGHEQVLALPSDTKFADTYVYSDHLQTRIMKAPYVEVGCGIGNILRFLNIWATWRLTNRYEGAPKWAIRAQFNFGT